MQEYFDSAFDITQDLLAGDVNVKDKRDAGDNNYQFLTTGVIVEVPTTTADEAGTSYDLTVLLRGRGVAVLEVLPNVIYPIAVETVFKAGTTTQSVILLGRIS